MYFSLPGVSVHGVVHLQLARYLSTSIGYRIDSGGMNGLTNSDACRTKTSSVDLYSLLIKDPITVSYLNSNGVRSHFRDL